MTSLRDLLNPSAVAIVGASDDPTRIGGRPIAYMRDAGFAGAILPVNPKRRTVQGLPAAPSVADLDRPIDFAIVALPAPAVNDAIRAAIMKGAKGCVVFSSGFAEADAAGAARQAEMAEIARDTDARIIGPNCIGVFNARNGFVASFSSTLDRGPPLPGEVAVASQSGAYGCHIYFVARRRGVNVGKLVSTGNEVDVDVADAIRLFAEDDEIHTIIAYAEGVKDGSKLIAALETARDARKPVIFMKVGRSEVGAAAAGSHTAALAGEDAVYDAVLRQYGAHRARSTEEIVDIAYACRPRIFPTGRRLGLVTISGGAGVLMADAAKDFGVDTPPMPADAMAELKAVVPFASARNPVDVTAQVLNDASLVEANLRIMQVRGGYDAVLAFWASLAGSPAVADRLIEAVERAIAGFEDRLMVHALVATREIIAKYQALGHLVFEDPTRAVGAIAALMRFGEVFAKQRDEAPWPACPSALPEGRLGEREARTILAAAGLPVVEGRLATTPAAAAEAARVFGGPVAMKIAGPDILHKTEIGAVALGVAASDAAAAFEAILAGAAERVPEARIDGVLVSPMVAGGVECILGAKIDPVFGPIVMAGIGGVFTEVLGDVALRRAPIGPTEARGMIEELKGAPLLQGARGTVPADLDAMADAIAKLSTFAAAHAATVESVELNPVRALPDGALALDALIVKRAGVP
jgi:acyl-CoA synthetase (NDP forming)